MTIALIAFCMLGLMLGNEYSPDINKFLNTDFTQKKIKR